MTKSVLLALSLCLLGCAAFPPGQPVPLLDGTSLAGWRILDELDFEGAGAVVIDGEERAVVLGAGVPMTGIAWTGSIPRDGYEISLEAKRIEGGDFFCGMTFPVGEEYCSLIIGGWGGSVVGLSNVDGYDASDNETTSGQGFEQDRWYAIKLRVTAAKIQAWIDDDRVIALDRPGRHFEIWIQQEPARPLGIATYYTKAALRNIVVERLTSS